MPRIIRDRNSILPPLSSTVPLSIWNDNVRPTTYFTVFYLIQINASSHRQLDFKDFLTGIF